MSTKLDMSFRANVAENELTKGLSGVCALTTSSGSFLVVGAVFQ